MTNTGKEIDPHDKKRRDQFRTVDISTKAWRFGGLYQFLGSTSTPLGRKIIGHHHHYHHHYYHHVCIFYSKTSIWVFSFLYPFIPFLFTLCCTHTQRLHSGKRDRSYCIFCFYEKILETYQYHGCYTTRFFYFGVCRGEKILIGHSNCNYPSPSRLGPLKTQTLSLSYKNVGCCK